MSYFTILINTGLSRFRSSESGAWTVRDSKKCLTRIRRTFVIKGEHFLLVRNRRIEGKQCQHATGFSLFRALGVITMEVTGSAHAAVVNFEHALCSALFDNFGREIDLVMRR